MIERMKHIGKYLWYFTCCWPCRFFCLFFFQAKAYNHTVIPRKGGFLMLANHQSYLDPLIVATPVTRLCCFAARETLFESPWFGWLLGSFNVIGIKRDQANLDAMRLFVNRLKAGFGMLLFPEGTRTLDGKIAEFKPGFGIIARKANVPIIPVIIDGAFECWPKKHKLFRPGKTYVVYGKPISPEHIKQIGDREFAKELTRTLRQMQNELRIKVGREPYDYEDLK